MSDKNNLDLRFRSVDSGCRFMGPAQAPKAVSSFDFEPLKPGFKNHPAILSGTKPLPLKIATTKLCPLSTPLILHVA